MFIMSCSDLGQSVNCEYWLQARTSMIFFLISQDFCKEQPVADHFALRALEKEKKVIYMI